MISTQSSVEDSSLELPPPPKFEKVEDILRMPNELIQRNPLVNVIGLIRDYQPPMPTKGTSGDYKCTFAIVDLSTQMEHGDLGKGIKVSIFWPEDKMPRISGVRDAVLLRRFKVQMWDGSISLLANWSSAVQVIPASQLSANFNPKPTLSKNAGPSPVETKYAVWLFHHLDKNLFPAPQRFQENSVLAQNVNRREKFSLLKDVKEYKFYDLVGEVIHHYERDGRVTLYISDYTPHSLFFDNVWVGAANESSARDGDEYGYTKSRKKITTDWPGPYGKMSIQITAYDNHANFISNKVKVKDWVYLRNVHIKMGTQGGCLEGFLRGDRDGWDAWDGKVNVKIINKAEDAEGNDVRWKDGLRRKKEYWDRFDKQKQRFLRETESSDGKRNLEEGEVPKPNRKKRRQEERAAVEQKLRVIEEKAIEKLDLNSNVKCNYPDIARTPLAKILNDIPSLQSISGAEYPLPFQNVKYRSDVRVIDFWPNKIENFAVGRRASEYDVLSDYSGGESTDNEEDMRLFREGKGYGGQKTWEWRFALRVRDANKNTDIDQDTMWLVVDNSSAQMLLGIGASNLRRDDEALTFVEETLFKLWGDLAEKKAAYMAKRNRETNANTENSAKSRAGGIAVSALSATRGEDLPPDSDDESISESRATKDSSKTVSKDGNADNSETEVLDEGNSDSNLSAAIASLPIKNKGFTCCIQQYGIKVPEESPSKADAGDGLRWRRVFGIFGTRIV